MSENKLIKIQVKTARRQELIDITNEIEKAIKTSGVKSGVAILYVPHTTAGLAINEHADPSVKSDIENFLSRLVPAGYHYLHLEGNADSHIKSVLMGNSLTVIIENGSLLLGTWQGIFFCEFDGPRARNVYIKIIEG
jgi:secondary thiamine-phosphate synthase enzyme